MKNILDKIFYEKRKEVEERKKIIKIDELIELSKNKKIRNFVKPFEEKEFSIIGEVKKASPSKGIIRKDFNPVEIAKIYEDEGIACISVLTDEQFFQGKLDYLMQIKKAVSLPLLRKDFIFEEYQIYEAISYGADAILLIVKMLDENVFKQLFNKAKSLGLSVLVETHNEKEIRTALDVGAKLIGINNRNLDSFVTSLNVTEKLMKIVPKNQIIISESGISRSEDILRLKSLGVKGALIGEAFTKEKDIAKKVKQLIK